ncbi:hypothetical protein F0562_032275 [Nyssa sinensis]|uniref:Uncharacterized protein n=1 Tax=Nyssa sinensis TaxID=561372 RepID=A0A5J5AR81_9ASTE|nr:hypothetical protein F0562_032275 [Nyssa sinensis]
MVNQGGGTNILAATKGAFSNLRGASKWLSPTAVEGSMGLVNTMDIGAECVANPLESRLDDIRKGVDGAAKEDASIHDTYSAHSWADRVDEGEFIPQAPLDLEAEGSKSLNNGSHGGRGGGKSGAQVARGILTNKHSFRPAICGKEGLSLQDQNGDFPLGNSETHGGDGRPTLEKQKGENSGTISLVRPALCCKKGLTKKVTNDQYPMGTSGTYERAGRPSQDKQKADGTATSSSDLGCNRGVANGDQLVGNAIN